MDFYAVLDQVVDLLRQRQRVTYRALKLQFQLDDEALEALKDELIYAKKLAMDEDGKVLVWTGDPAPVPSATIPPTESSRQTPLAYTPAYLAEKILTSRSALGGERKHVTVLFADLKGSMELLADRDPEEARQLLDPVLERMMAAVRDRLWLMNCGEELGEFAEGVAYGEEAARIAETAGHIGSAIMAQYRLGQFALRQGALQLAISRLTHALAQCRAGDALLWVPAASANLGLAYALSGRILEALSLLDQIEVRETPAMGGSSVMLKMGEAYLLASRVADAHRLAERALALARDRKERGHQAWALRLWGQMAAYHDSPAFASATAYYRQALTLAEELGMRPLQAHCHRGLGMLYAKVDQREQAHQALSTAIEMYRSMDMTFWLPETEAARVQVEGR